MVRSRLLMAVLAALVGVGPACKVPLSDIDAEFLIADTAWFAEEETLFVFYKVTAEQGLGDESVLEIRYTTDDGSVAWTSLNELPSVHTHLSVDCGFESRCGSRSIHVPKEPREVALRLRYHRDGVVSLDASTLFNVVGPGPAHSHRSLLVYGVLDKLNHAVQWRARHRFPTIRNEQAEELGLRRRFVIEAQRFGDLDLDLSNNPYAYGVDCPPSFTALDLATVETDARAVFNPDDLPPGASAAATVCANATVYDPTGPFTTTALARKNPEVRPAFPLLRSPIRDATPIKYVLSVCERTISSGHLAMQRQRLLIEGVSPVCIDDWTHERLVDELSARFKEDIERVRADGRDMVIAIALHHDTPSLGPVIEEVLSTTLAAERDRTTPRVAGAFLLDSYGYHVDNADVRRAVIWCPADLPEELGFDDEDSGDGESESTPDGGLDAGATEISPTDADTTDHRAPDGGKTDGGSPGPEKGDGGAPGGDKGDGGGGEKGDGGQPDDKEPNLGDLAIDPSLACVIMPDTPSLSLGPFDLGTLPIFPSREMYLDFIDTYSDDQAGRMRSLAFRVPELPANAEHVPLGMFGVATFLNDEVITADADDAFSYCETEEYAGFVFRAAGPPDLLPLQALPGWHELAGGENYPIGIVWDFPYLLHIEYETIFAGAVSAFSASVPVGIGVQSEDDFGSEVWTTDEFPLAETLTQCRRFCDHPTFDSAGVYHVSDGFRSAYLYACYAPLFPQRGDSGFPHDP